MRLAGCFCGPIAPIYRHTELRPSQKRGALGWDDIGGLTRSRDAPRKVVSAIQSIFGGCAMSETVEFNSCGDVCKAVLTRPGGKSDNVPLVIMAGGWCYTKE